MTYVSDELLVQVTQELERKLEEQLKSSSSYKLQSFVTAAHVTVYSQTVVTSMVASDAQFSSPCSLIQIDQVKDSRIPSKTKANTTWSTNVWREWATYHKEHIIP